MQQIRCNARLISGRRQFSTGLQENQISDELFDIKHHICGKCAIWECKIPDTLTPSYRAEWQSVHRAQWQHMHKLSLPRSGRLLKYRSGTKFHLVQFHANGN